MTLRKCQTDALQVVINNIKIKKKNFFLNLATGSGKTLLSCEIIDTFLQRNKGAKVLFLAPRKNLITQTMNTIKGFKKNGKTFVQKGYSVGNLKSSSNIILETIQSTSTRLKELKKDEFDLIIFDEVHIGMQSKSVGKFKEIFYHFENSTRIGLTATPRNFLDENLKKTINTFGDMDFQYSLQEGIDDKNLSPPGKITIFKSDEEITNLGLQESIIQIGDKIIELLPELEYKTIVFCSVDTKHAKPLYEYINESGKINKKEISRITGDYQNGLNNFINEKNPKIAVTSKLLSVGTDIPEVKNIILCKKTNSKIELQQTIGRAVRLIDGKQVPFNIYDFGDNEELIKDILEEDDLKLNVIYKDFDFKKQSIQKNNLCSKTETKKSEIEFTDKKEIIMNLREVNDLIVDQQVSLYKDRNVVYVLSNDAMEGMVKIGFTTRTAEERAKELFTTSTPEPFKIELAHHCDDPAKLEKELHNFFDEYRVNDRREFFEGVTAEEVQIAINAIENEEATTIVEKAKQEKDDAICILKTVKEEVETLKTRIFKLEGERIEYKTQLTLANKGIVQMKTENTLLAATNEELKIDIQEMKEKYEEKVRILRESVEASNEHIQSTNKVTQETLSFMEEFKVKLEDASDANEELVIELKQKDLHIEELEKACRGRVKLIDDLDETQRELAKVKEENERLQDHMEEACSLLTQVKKSEEITAELLKKNESLEESDKINKKKLKEAESKAEELQKEIDEMNIMKVIKKKWRK